MTKDENIENPNSCWNLADAKEPVFILRANDELAPIAIENWAYSYRESKGGFVLMTEEQKTKYWNARAEANVMREWKIKQTILEGNQ